MSRTSASGKVDASRERHAPEAAVVATDELKPLQARRSHRNRAVAVLRWMSPLILIGLWEAVVQAGLVDRVMLPPASAVVERAAELFAAGELQTDIVASVRRIVVGFALGAGLALAVGFLMASYRWVDALLDYPIQALRGVSPLALLPLSVLWLGIGETQKYFVMSYAVFFPVMISVYSSIRATPSTFVDAARTLGVSRSGEMFRRVILPYSVPGIISGLRIGLGIGFVAIIGTEMIAAQEGLGYRILDAGRVFRSEDVFVGVLVIGALSILSDRVMRYGRRLLAPWYTDLGEEVSE